MSFDFPKFHNRIVKLPAYRAGPFDKAHGPEQVEGLAGHAPAKPKFKIENA